MAVVGSMLAGSVDLGHSSPSTVLILQKDSWQEGAGQAIKPQTLSLVTVF